MTSVAIHVDQLFYRVPGGIGTYVSRLLPALRAADPELDVAAFHARFDRRPPPELDGVRRVEIPRGIKTLYPLWNVAGRPPLPRSLDAAEIVHAPTPVAVPPVRPGQRLVVTVHDLAFLLHPTAYPKAWRLLHVAGLRRAVRTAAAIITVSSHTAHDLERLTRVDPRLLHVVPHGGSLPVGGHDPSAVLQRLRIPRPYVLFVGALEPRKNVDRLLRAFAEVAPRVPHALVLTGPVSRWFRRKNPRGPAGRVILTGRVSEGTLDALHRGADAFVYPSLYEGFGLPVLDAMARGVPVVTSNVSALPELAGDAALLVPPTSVPAIAAGLERVLTDEHERVRLARAGRARAREYTWERTARATLEVYERAGAA